MPWQHHFLAEADAKIDFRSTSFRMGSDSGNGHQSRQNYIICFVKLITQDLQ